jgi:hypothetical protein
VSHRLHPGHGESAALPLLLLQIAAVTVGLPQHSFCYCRCMISLPLRCPSNVKEFLKLGCNH